MALPFQWGAAIRHRRVFHPDGALAAGSIERVAPLHEGLPITTSPDVVARLSKGIGTPIAMPDIIGLAIRIPPQRSAATPWDILLASAGSGVLTRTAVVRPVLGWSGRTMSSVMPLSYQGKHWWVRARMTSDINGFGVSLDAIRAQLSRDCIKFDIDQACGTRAFRPLARLTLNNLIPYDQSVDVAFDPVLHTAHGVQVVPGWLAGIRSRAYERSRRGRHAG